MLSRGRSTFSSLLTPSNTGAGAAEAPVPFKPHGGGATKVYLEDGHLEKKQRWKLVSKSMLLKKALDKARSKRERNWQSKEGEGEEEGEEEGDENGEEDCGGTPEPSALSSAGGAAVGLAPPPFPHLCTSLFHDVPPSPAPAASAAFGSGSDGMDPFYLSQWANLD